MIQLGRYEKIVMLSTFDKPRTLGEIGSIWYKNKGRLYQEQIQKELKKAVKSRRIAKQGNKYNVHPDFIKEVIKDFSGSKKEIVAYRRLLEKFYIKLKDYTQPVYLNLEVMRELSEHNEKKAIELDLRFVIQLPFMLSYVDSLSKKVYEIIVGALSLGGYVTLLHRLEMQHYHVIDETKRKFDFVEAFDALEKQFPSVENHEIPKFSKNLTMMKRGSSKR